MQIIEISVLIGQPMDAQHLSLAVQDEHLTFTTHVVDMILHTVISLALRRGNGGLRHFELASMPFSKKTWHLIAQRAV